MNYMGEILAVILTLTFIFGFCPNIVHATTFTQGTRKTVITPEGGVAVSDNGGRAGALDNSVAVSHGNGSQSEASGHSTAVSTAQDNSQSFSNARKDSTANSNAQDNSIAIFSADTATT